MFPLEIYLILTKKERKIRKTKTIVKIKRNKERKSTKNHSKRLWSEIHVDISDEIASINSQSFKKITPWDQPINFRIF